MQKLIVTINGRNYDTRTGMPVPQPSQTPSTGSNPGVYSASFHQHTQKSQTLNRRFVHDPYRKPESAQVPSLANANVTQQITKFYQNTHTAKAPVPQSTISDFKPVANPTAHRVSQKLSHQTPAKSMPKPSDVLKREAISEALAKAPSHSGRKQSKQYKQKNNKWSLARLVTAGSTLVLIGGYFTYLNMPNLSVKIAAAQAGIDASYPSYHPTGYSLSGPIAYDSGQVRMSFAMNGSDRTFNLDQTKSTWDSSAVYENFVKPKVGNDYIATQAGGLTIYTFESNAAWVSNGILYTISGDAPLSPDQIKQIAASM